MPTVYIRSPYKELIVLNDCTMQELVCDAPGVRVVNLPERFPSLGDKYNAAVRLSRGELIAPWDDDDISLPWRLSLSVERLGDADYFNVGPIWIPDSDGHLRLNGAEIAHNSSLFRRVAFEAVGGYPPISRAADAVLHHALLVQRERVVARSRGDAELANSEVYYIHRLGISPVHLSRNAEGYYGHVGTLPVEPGRFRLDPHWRTDYEAEMRQLLAANLAA